MEEDIECDGKPIFLREKADVTVRSDVTFTLDWHVPALPVVGDKQHAEEIRQVRDWFASMILIQPVPSLMEPYAEVAETTD